MTAAHLSEVTSEDIDCFMEYLSYYIRPDYENPAYGKEMHNEEKGKSRKLAAVRMLFKYLYKKKIISADLPLWSIPRKSTKKLLCVWM